MADFQLRNVPLLSRVGADRADVLRTDLDAAVAGWSDALLLRVDRRNQVLISGGRVVLGAAVKHSKTPDEHAVFLGRLEDAIRQQQRVVDQARVAAEASGSAWRERC